MTPQSSGPSRQGGRMKITGAVLERVGDARPYASSRPLVVRELELDPPGAGELLVRIEVAGVCHSDLSVVDGSRARPLPMLLGHEAAGIVEAPGRRSHGCRRRRSGRDDLPPALRGVRRLRYRGPDAVRARIGGQRNRRAPRRRAPPPRRWPRCPPPPGRLGLRRPRRRLTTLRRAGTGRRPRRGRRASRLRGAHRRGRRAERGEAGRRRHRDGRRARRRRDGGAPRRGRSATR